MNAASAPFQAVTSLFPDSPERTRVEEFLTEALQKSSGRVRQGRVSAALDLTSFRDELDEFDFVSPRSLDDVLGWTIGHLEHGIVHVTHPRYFGLFNPAPSFPAECADRIVASFNPQLASSKTSPVPVDIEAHVIRAFASRAGLPAGARGHFTTGGSEANFTALLCALTRGHPEFSSNGARAYRGQPVLYVSEDAHLAWYKIVHQAGIGRSALHSVACDGAGRMDMGALASAIEADKAAGRVPVMIAATAGTTCAGMIDPLAECAGLARSHGIWFHVDAAWGGAVLVSDTLRHAIAGIEAADSVTIDAHKWLATTMACGMFIARDGSALSETFHVAATFMPSNIADLDPYVASVQWSRRFLGLRLFVALSVAGWQGYADHVERAVALAHLLSQELGKRGWTVANDSPMAVVCARPPPGYPDTRSIAHDIVSTGVAWVSCLSFRGHEIVRICITNGTTSPRDVLELVDLLSSFRHQTQFTEVND